MLIIVPAMAQWAQSAAINTMPNGSLWVTSADTGTNHINANGGVSPIVSIAYFTVLTPDAGNNGINVNSAGYFDAGFNPANPTFPTLAVPLNGIYNAGSVVGAMHGLSAGGNKITLYNTGTLADSSTGGTSAVVGLGNGSVIANSGTMNGAFDAIWNFGVDTVTVHNTGTIDGDTDNNGTGSGIMLRNNAIIVNSAGTVTGAHNGVWLIDDGSISNARGATIRGDDDSNGTGSGISYGNDTTPLNTVADISNYGTINGANGVNAGTNVSIQNRTSFTLGNPVAGGIIAGSVSGIVGDDYLNVLNENLGSITGITGAGIQADNNASITNNLGALIRSVDTDGVRMDFGIVANHGSIMGGPGTGDNGIAVNGGGASIIINDGTISAYQGISILGADNDILHNFATITGSGGVAINMGGGADVVNLNTNFPNPGSVINGSIDGGLGADILNFIGGKTYSLDFTGNVVHGNVSMETINKTGTGTAFIGTSGDPLYTVLTDAINLNVGGLTINGDIFELTAGGAPTQIAALAGTELGGTGTWIADISLTNATISAGPTPLTVTGTATNAIGTLRTIGNVTSNGANTIRYDVRPQAVTPVAGLGAGDLIDHSGGTYSLGTNTTVAISPTNINQVMSNGTYTVIDSKASITGTLPALAVQFNGWWLVPDTGFIGSLTTGSIVTNTVLENNFTTVSLAGGSSDLVFTINHNYAGLPGLTPNESALGGAIDQLISSPSALMQDFIAALDYSDLATVQTTLATLNPEAYMNQAAAVVNSNYRLHRMTQEHLAYVRGGQTITKAAPAVTGAKGAIVAPTVSSSTSMGNVWGAYSYDWQDYQAGNSRGDYNGDVSSFTVGFDWRVAPSFVLGAVFDGSTASYDGTGNSSEIESVRGALYGTWGEALGIYSDFLVGYGTHDMDLKRGFGGILSGYAGSSSTDATSVQALWTVGYTMGDESIKHGPLVGLEYQNINVDNLSETGPLPLSMDSYDIDSFRGLIGYRMNACFDKFRPYASVVYAYEFADDNASATAHLSSASFRVNGAEQGSALLLSLGTAYALTDSLSIDLGYRGEIALDDGMSSHSGTIGVNYSF